MLIEKQSTMIVGYKTKWKSICFLQMESLKIEMTRQHQIGKPAVQCVHGAVQGEVHLFLLLHTLPAPLRIIVKPQLHMSLESICTFPLFSTKIQLICISGSQWEVSAWSLHNLCMHNILKACLFCWLKNKPFQRTRNLRSFPN